MATFVRRDGRWATLAVVWSLYGVACLMPAIHIKPGPWSAQGFGGAFPGWMLTYLGVFVLYSPSEWAWLANPALVIGSALLAAGRAGGALAAAVVPLLLSAACWLPSDMVERLLVGYYLWVASMAALAAGAWYARRARHQPGEA